MMAHIIGAIAAKKVEWGKLVGYVLVGLVLLIEVPRFFGAYNGVDISWLTALGTGIVLPAGSGYIFHTWWKSKRNNKAWLFVPFGALLILEPLILVPWGIGRLYGESLAATLHNRGWGIAWITLVMLSPFAMVAGVVMALAFQKETKQHATTTDVPRQEIATPQPATKLEHVKALASFHPEWDRLRLATEAGCSASTVSRALAGDNGTERVAVQERHDAR